jgi:TPR repeat protein
LKNDSEKGLTQSDKRFNYLKRNSNNFSPEHAFREYKALADEGHIPSMSEIGRRYASGIGIARDSVEAEKWLKAVADSGNAWGRFSLGRFYRIQKNYEEARRYLALAAAAESAPALLDLGKMYLWGQGMDKDLQKATEYFKRSADAGNISAKAQWGHLLLREKSLQSKLTGICLIGRAVLSVLPAVIREGEKSQRLIR